MKSREELAALYEGKGITADKDIIAYCRIGERSATRGSSSTSCSATSASGTTTAAGPSTAAWVGVPIENPAAQQVARASRPEESLAGSGPATPRA